MPQPVAVRLKPVCEQVIVITGASSGIGRTTAILAAERGAQVVVAARNRSALDTLVAGIVGKGGKALAVTCDVTDPAAVETLAAQAAEWGGRIDTWVNNAGVAIAGRLEELPDEDARRLFDVNFWGMVAGCKAALPFLERQGGALINLGSFVSDVASPFMGIYSASKQATKGYTDGLRIELMMERKPISVTLIKPSPIATPVLQQQRNRLERQATMPPPFYRPEDVSEAILYAAEHRRRDLFVGGYGAAGQRPRSTLSVDHRFRCGAGWAKHVHDRQAQGRSAGQSFCAIHCRSRTRRHAWSCTKAKHLYGPAGPAVADSRTDCGKRAAHGRGCRTSSSLTHGRAERPIDTG